MGLIQDLVKDKTKSIERDIGLVEDTFGMLCDMTAFEDHSEASFLSSGDESELLDKNWMRNMRSYYLDLVAKNCKGNGWCKVKHLCRIAKGLQEDCSRFLSINDLKSAKKCAKDYGEVYIKFLKLTGHTEGDMKNESSA